MDFYRPFRCLPTSSHSPTIKKVVEVSPPGHFLPVHQLAVRASNSPTGIHFPSKGGQTVGTKTRYPVAPISGRLADQGTFPSRIKETYFQPPLSDSITGLHSESTEVGTHTPTEVQFHRYHFLLDRGSCQAHGRQMGQNSELLPQDLKEVCYQCKDSYVHHWITSIHREDSKTGQDTYETHWKFPMPLNSRIPWTQKMKQHGEWWLDPQNVVSGEFLHQRDHDVLIFTDASNAGWGAHLDHDSTGSL